SCSGEIVDVVLNLASHVHFRVTRRDDPAFISRVFEPLGATPVSVLNVGGCCSGLARLLIVSLDSLGIPATQITLSHRKLHYRHCLVEARIASGRTIIVDPKYGMYYEDGAGRLLGLEDLRAGIDPHFTPIPGRLRAAYPDHELFDWEYRKTVT